MAGTFPTLRSGNTLFYPLQDTHSFGTDKLRFLDDTEQRWRQRKMLRRFKLTFSNITAYDSALILNFYRSQFGSFDTWSLPFNGATVANLVFVADSLQMAESKRNRHSMSFDVVQVKSANPTIPSSQPYYPQLPGGITTGLPYSNQYNYRTTKESTEFGKQYAHKWRSNPLGSFSIHYPALTSSELSIVQNFFYAMEGMKRSFSFLDPGGSLVNYSDAFSHASWLKTSLAVGAAATDPFGGLLATSIASTASTGRMYTLVLPSGNASGYVMTASVWVNPVSAGQQLKIGFEDNSGNILGATVWDAPAGAWTRIYHTITLATNAAVRMFIGGDSTWWSTTIKLFSAQCTPLPGIGPRLLTPGADALRPLCRFDTDEFEISYQEFNLTTVTLPIVEHS